jgi:hypothetical protein
MARQQQLKTTLARLPRLTSVSQKLDAIAILADYKEDSAAEGIGQLLASKPTDEKVLDHGMDALIRMATPAAMKVLGELAKRDDLPPMRQVVPVRRIEETLRHDPTNEAAAEVLDTLSKDKTAPPRVTDMAKSAIVGLAKSTPLNLEKLQNLKVDAIAVPARKELARLKALDPTMPVGDVWVIEQWKQRQIELLEGNIRQYNDFLATPPGRMAGPSERKARLYMYKNAIATTNEQEKKLKANSVKDSAVQLLAEYYEATKKSEAAAKAADAYQNMAEAAKNLPSIEATQVSVERYANGQEVRHEGGSYEIPVGALTSLFMSSMAADKATQSVLAARAADGDSQYLTQLSEKTMEATKLGYIAWVKDHAPASRHPAPHATSRPAPAQTTHFGRTRPF